MLQHKVRIVGGSCGTTLIRITDHLREWITQDLGYTCKVDYQNVWESFGPPPEADLILQTMPAYTAADTSTPIIPIKPLIIDLEHPATLEKIRLALKNCYGEAPHGSES